MPTVTSLQPVTPSDMHSGACVAHQAKQPDGSPALYSASMPLYALQGTLGGVTGWTTWDRTLCLSSGRTVNGSLIVELLLLGIWSDNKMDSKSVATPQLANTNANWFRAREPALVINCSSRS